MKAPFRPTRHGWQNEHQMNSQKMLYWKGLLRFELIVHLYVMDHFTNFLGEDQTKKHMFKITTTQKLQPAYVTHWCFQTKGTFISNPCYSFGSKINQN